MQGREGLNWPLHRRPAPCSATIRSDRLDHTNAAHDSGHGRIDDYAGHSRQSPRHDPATLISARGLSLAPGRPAELAGVDIDIAPGEIVTVIGPNGAGKTMLVRALLGLERLDRGEVRRGSASSSATPAALRHRPGDPLTVARFVSLGRPLQPAGDRERTRQRRRWRPDRPPASELSGGELRRVVLARALVRSPDLLVLDEPARQVDYAGEAELYTLIGRLRTEQGFGMLLVSHDLHVVMAQSVRVIASGAMSAARACPHRSQHTEYVRLFGRRRRMPSASISTSTTTATTWRGQPVPRKSAVGSQTTQ